MDDVPETREIKTTLSARSPALDARVICRPFEAEAVPRHMNVIDDRGCQATHAWNKPAPVDADILLD